MGILKFKERDENLVKVHFQFSCISRAQVVGGIRSFQTLMLTNDFYKSEFGFDVLQNSAGEYFVLRHDECFVYLGFVTEAVTQYYVDNSAEYMLTAVKSGRYGNYFLPIHGSDDDLFHLDHGAHYYPISQLEKWSKVDAILKTIFGDLISMQRVVREVSLDVVADERYNINLHRRTTKVLTSRLKKYFQED